ncbi:SVAGG family GlyGly-CTERM protein [Shewanella sp. AS1]|uniref:SVAGG family GlyGly-CTERM protein n=1 Tax=Shewanella sp. AS1 TaxID=2907626 RepID=UPI001F17407C|nr:SVAGG family GlyGly-CTERM protein [Shewanella sp. AS1]MCE9679123.1 SVAGG family GlyGly-CTERM protein [Shewanella sp. AS1]
MKIKLFALIFAMMFSVGLKASEVVDLLVVVEPGVYENLSQEQFSKALNKQVLIANSEFKQFNVEYNISSVVTWDDNGISDAMNQGDSLAGVLGHLMYSIGETEASFDEDYFIWAGKFNQKIKSLVDYYHADKLVFVSRDTTGSTGGTLLGRGFQNKGVYLASEFLESDPITLAHELGHTFGLGHTSNEQCDTAVYLMCQGSYIFTVEESVGFTVEDAQRVEGVMNRDPEYLWDDYSEAFWVGDYSERQTYDANVALSVVDSVLNYGVNETEVVLSLVDANGVELPLTKTASIDLYVEGRGADGTNYYDDAVYQTVTFAPGETTKRIDLAVEHGDSQMVLNVGARYGVSLTDSNVATVTVEAVPADNGNDNGDSGDSGDSGEKSSGGSLGFLSLLLLACFGRKKRV